MMRKEAIECFLDHMPVKLMPMAREAYSLAISALRPLTDEAVQMVMERLEALYNE